MNEKILDIAGHPATWDQRRLLRDCQITRTRRSGPGGQHRNKVETAVVILHVPTNIRAEANETRSQADNQQQAVHRLRVNLALAVRVVLPPDCPASDLWRSRVHAGKITVSPRHADFPALLAEALDHVSWAEFDLTAAAKRLAISPSQLIKFLQVESRAMAQVNVARQTAGLRAMR